MSAGPAAVTATPGRTAPVLSVMTPVMRPRSSCAGDGSAVRPTTRTTSSAEETRNREWVTADLLAELTLLNCDPDTSVPRGYVDSSGFCRQKLVGPLRRKGTGSGKNK